MRIDIERMTISEALDELKIIESTSEDGNIIAQCQDHFFTLSNVIRFIEEVEDA